LREKALEEFVQRLVPPEQPSDDGRRSFHSERVVSVPAALV
jgi:hypothetical protein